MDRLTRKELKTDKFALEVEHTVDFLAAHRQQVIRYGGIALGVLALVLGIYGYTRYQSGQRQQALRAATMIQDAAVGENPSGIGPSFKTQAEKEAAALKAFGEVYAKYSGSEEGQIARHYMGAILADQGKIADAEKAFREVEAQGGQYGALARFTLATLYHAQGRNDEAEKMLRSLSANPTTLVSREQSLIALARVIGRSKPQEARKILEDLQKETPDRTSVSRAAVGVLGEIMQ